MDCPYVPDLRYDDFSKRLRQKAAGLRIPLSGSLELNYRCNLRCQHCYVAHGHTGIPGRQELAFAEIDRIFGEIADAGCLWLLLTGGEPLMRRDFKEIYLAAKRRGLLITLFTNGTRLTPEMADFLAEYRPFNLEITLYGYTQETYERVTGIPGSHRRCYQGIELLMERQVILGLKTVIMTLNRHEFDQMQGFAESLGVRFRFDGMINAGLDGSGKPRNLRIAPGDLVQIEFQSEKRLDYWRDRLQKKDNGKNGQEPYLYKCSAGIHSFHIDPYGQLSLCMLARQNCYDLRCGSFQQGWDVFLRQERFQPAVSANSCSDCCLEPVCSNCPGWSEIEYGNQHQRVLYLCDISRARAHLLNYIDYELPSRLLNLQGVR